jgi:hypothetical protein
MKGFGARGIHTALSPVLGDDYYTPVAAESWLARFREGDLSCPDYSRSGRPMIDASESLRPFLDKFPFASANTMLKYFRVTCGIIMEILQRGLGFKKFSHRRVPYQLSSSPKGRSCQAFSRSIAPVAIVTTVRFRGNNNRRPVLA